MLKNLHHIQYRRFIFSVNDYFLTEKVNSNADINYYIQCSQNVKNALSEFYTLLIDLAQPLEKIREAIYHRTWSEINSFLTNQVFEYKITYHLTDKELECFIHLFDEFAEKKYIRKAEVARLNAYNKAGVLAISSITQKNKVLVVNFYRLTQERASNISSFRIKEAEQMTNNSHLGRARRALHWLDILEFKKAGVKYYDFCGWYNGTQNQELLNINKFKEQFTNLKVKEYSGVIYKNRLVILLLKWFK